MLALSLVAARDVAGRAFESALVTFFPGSLTVEVLPGDTRLPVGSPLTIHASVHAGGRQLSRVTPALVVSDGRDSRTVAMSAEDGRFEFGFESVDRTFRYRVAAGASHSADYTVTALTAPRVTQIELHYEYPSFTRLAPRDEVGGGDIFAPEGTRVRVRVHADKPVRSGALAMGSGTTAALSQAGEKALETTIQLAKNDSYRIALSDADDLRSSGETEYFIRLMDDRPPAVHIVRPEGDQQVTPLEEVSIEAQAEDDHGIARLELVYAVAGGASKVVALGGNATSDPKIRAGTHVVAVEDLNVQPGDVISYYARARDVSRGKRSTETRSDMYFLEVRPFSEEFVNAQSQSMSGATGDQIEALIAAQKEIINATWTIERRASAGAGRSANDVRAIAQAQAELKGRVEQITGGGRGGGRIGFPQQIRPMRQGRGPAAGDPVGAAVSAMGRAVDELESHRPGDALSHEMAALRGLLQAQAEVKRREVAQSGAAMGGMGRQGQDLSALFDKELQRQQRTNYETQSRIESQPDRQDGASALDAIKDLARRQEDLSRRLSDAARSAESPEAAARQLEKLTREQMELQAQMDTLAKQQQKDGSRDAMRRAADEMRSAAGDLQRRDAAGASQRASRAAEGLRRLEEQLQGSGPEATRQAAGELRMEAQQVAQEQRRIADEAGRLGRGSVDSDAWRRLAGDKDTLADRVDALQRSAERVAATGTQQGTSNEASRAAAAASELKQQAIAEEMRRSADRMRDGTSGAKAGGGSSAPAPADRAESEQQLANALGRIVDRLGSGEGTGDIARALGESRKLREGLEQLERRIRDAEAQQGSAAQGRGRSSGRSGGTEPGETLRQLREQYARESQRTRDALSRLERNDPNGGRGGGTSPEGHEWSMTDQGSEPFKQDFSNWEMLKKDVESALERYEASVAARAARQSLQDRLSSGGSERVPDAYRELIARYYESLARKK